MGISLLSIAGKILAWVFLNQLTNVSEANLPEAQYGFCPGHSMVDMIFSMQQVQEKCIGQNLDLYFIFINMTKAFDTVNREALWSVLVCYSYPQKFIQIIRLFHVLSSPLKWQSFWSFWDFQWGEARLCPGTNSFQIVLHLCPELHIIRV